MSKEEMLNPKWVEPLLQINKKISKKGMDLLSIKDELVDLFDFMLQSNIVVVKDGKAIWIYDPELHKHLIKRSVEYKRR